MKPTTINLFDKTDLGTVTDTIPYDFPATRTRPKRPITIVIENLKPGESVLHTHHESSTLTRIRKQFPDRVYKRSTDPATSLTRIWRVT